MILSNRYLLTKDLINGSHGKFKLFGLILYSAVGICEYKLRNSSLRRMLF